MTSREVAMEEGVSCKPKYDPPTAFSLFELNDVAEFLSIDSDLWVFRRFGKLHLFSVLGIQQRLVMLEHELEMQLSGKAPRDSDNLLANIQQALKDYGTLYGISPFLDVYPLAS
jgi:hypothetical protein